MKALRCTILTLVCLCLIPITQADTYEDLYDAAGWPVQVDHFESALQMMQNQYKEVLPALLYQTVASFSSQRFESTSMKQRGLSALKANLINPDPALVFFNSDLGKKIVTAETEATSKESIQKNQQGVPKIKISGDRSALFKQLATAIPYRQATVNVSASLTGIVGETVESLFPGMGLGDTVKQVTPTKAQIEQQVDAHLDSILIYVYRSLTDQELRQFIAFAESSAGQAYYNAAQEVIMVSLNK